MPNRGGRGAAGGSKQPLVGDLSLDLGDLMKGGLEKLTEVRLSGCRGNQREEVLASNLFLGPR